MTLFLRRHMHIRLHIVMVMVMVMGRRGRILARMVQDVMLGVMHRRA